MLVFLKVKRFLTHFDPQSIVRTTLASFDPHFILCDQRASKLIICFDCTSPVHVILDGSSQYNGLRVETLDVGALVVGMCVHSS